MNPSGRLVSIERVGITPHFCGWLSALSKAGFKKPTQSSQVLNTTEIDQECVFPIICLEKGEDEEGWSWFEFLTDIVCQGTIEDQIDWEAVVLLGVLKGRLIGGFSAYSADNNRKRVAKFALWHIKQATNAFLLEQLGYSPEKKRMLYQVLLMPSGDLDACKELMLERRAQFNVEKVIDEDGLE